MADISSAAPPSAAPSFDDDLHDEHSVVDPHPLYRRLRDAGAVVWMARHEAFAVTRYAEVNEALVNYKVFGAGFAMNDLGCMLTALLNLDPPEHERIRKVVGRPILPRAVEQLEPELRELAERTVADLKQRDSFDGVKDFAHVLPLGIVSAQIGLPPEGREQMLAWGAAGFDALGMLDNERTIRGMETVQHAADYMESVADGQLKPGSWSDMIMQAGARGEIPPDECVGYLQDFLYPSLDTTIHAASAGLKLFAANPDQWDLLRQDRKLLTGAVSEIVRLATPIQWFARKVREDHRLGDVDLPAGSRVLVLYGSANRDERQFPDPDRFDITRPPNAQLGFGRGKHACMGMPLARLELRVLFDALADSVERIEVGEERWVVNNVLYGLEYLETSFT
jgi:cytochrome P450